ncbi:MAG: hypothetical protein ACE5ID_06375 [Acidobacteriota bacterium]
MNRWLEPWAVRILLVLWILPLACRQADPLAQRLAERASYTVQVAGFRPDDEGTYLVELVVRATLSQSLKTLTVTVRQHDAGGETLQEDLVPVDLGGMDATGVLRTYVHVKKSARDVETLSAIVETNPVPEDFDRIPELQGLRPPAGAS